MDRQISTGERMLDDLGGKWWPEGAYDEPPRGEYEQGRPTREQALLGSTFVVASELVDEDTSPWLKAGEVERTLKALGDCVDKIASGNVEKTSRASVILYLGDLLQRLYENDPVRVVSEVERQS
jgi:hypothetical protein